MILSYSNEVKLNQLSGLIPKNNFALIEIQGDLPDTWINYGYVNVLIDDEILENRQPLIESLKLTNKGLIYIPNHSYDYLLSINLKTWLIATENKPLLNIYFDVISQNNLNFVTIDLFNSAINNIMTLLNTINSNTTPNNPKKKKK